MTNYWKKYFALTIPAIIAGMVLFSCSNDMETITGFAVDETIPIESARDVEYFYTENSILKSKLTAPVLNRFDIPEVYTELPEGFVLEMYDSSGVLTSTITAKYARRYENKKTMEAKYDVVLTDHIENKVMNTDYLIWDENQGKIRSDKFVKITTPDKIIFGDGFESDENFTEYYIVKPKGEIILTRDKEDSE